MHSDIERVLLTKEQIKKRVEELGAQISEDYKGKDLLLVGILKGSFVFMADLARAISIDVKLDFMAVSSYGAKTQSTGVVKIIKDLDTPIEGYDVLVVEDILDSGNTLGYITELLKARNPKSVKACTLLDKPERRLVHIDMGYVGFEVPDEFIVGYGLDCGEKYRNLEDINILRRSVYES